MPSEVHQPRRGHFVREAAYSNRAGATAAAQFLIVPMSFPRGPGDTVIPGWLAVSPGAQAGRNVYWHVSFALYPGKLSGVNTFFWKSAAWALLRADAGYEKGARPVARCRIGIERLRPTDQAVRDTSIREYRQLRRRADSHEFAVELMRPQVPFAGRHRP